ncbi:MAG: gamma-glutamylcyclotransferase family protein [Anaeromyxobacter sp.]
MKRRDDLAIDAPRFRAAEGHERRGSELCGTAPRHSISTPHRIFVYGTLLRGGTNHRLLDGALFLHRAKTRPEFTLYDLGEYPAMVTGGESAVHGEVFEVGPDIRRRLDELEEHPAYYRRTAIELADGMPAETYLLPREYAQYGVPIPSGLWSVRRTQTNDCGSSVLTLPSAPI